MSDIINLQRTDRLVDDEGRPTQRFHDWLNSVSDLTSAPIVAVAPEGVLRAREGKIVLFLAGAPGNKIFIKTTAFGDKTGWLAIA